MSRFMYWVYILRSDSADRYYIGQTDNPEKRINAHRSGKSEYTRRASDWYLVYKKEYETRKQAQKVENFIKRQKSRTFLEKIISGEMNLDIERIPG